MSSDSRLRSYKRVLDACPCIYHLARLDAERRRQGDGPWLPALLPPIVRIDGEFIYWVRIDGEFIYWFHRVGSIFSTPPTTRNLAHELWAASIPDPE